MIGKTPLINILNPEFGCRVWAKLETHNRTGSVKDRMIEYICDMAIMNGEITIGETTLIEATSGNTGIALASYASAIGCPCKIIMPCNMSEQRKQMMRAFGAEIIETGPNEFIKAIEVRDELVKTEDAFTPNQFANPLNVDCHRTTTALEIHKNILIQQLPKWSAFIHGAGTGGTMMGIKQYIDNKDLPTKCILTQPAEDNATHGIQGINDGADFLLQRSLMDECISIKTEDAINRMKQFWKEEGLLVGISSAANVLACEQWCRANPDIEGTVITILCDRGERYL